MTKTKISMLLAMIIAATAMFSQGIFADEDLKSVYKDEFNTIDYTNWILSDTNANDVSIIEQPGSKKNHVVQIICKANTKRGEIELHKKEAFHLNFGEEYWIGFSTYVKSYNNPAWGSIMQLHAVPSSINGTPDWDNVLCGHNPVTIRLDNENSKQGVEYSVAINGEPSNIAQEIAFAEKGTWRQKLTTGTWVRWVVHIIPNDGRYDSEGLVEVYKDSTENMIASDHGTNMDRMGKNNKPGSKNEPLTPYVYLKLGSYGEAQSTDRVMQYDKVKIYKGPNGLERAFNYY
jgi:hypothetical protein